MKNANTSSAQLAARYALTVCADGGKEQMYSASIGTADGAQFNRHSLAQRRPTSRRVINGPEKIAWHPNRQYPKTFLAKNTATHTHAHTGNLVDK